MSGIEVENLTCGYGQKAVLEGMSATFRPGGIHIILGINGAGKSTLIRLLNRFLTPRSGRVLLAGADLAGFSPARLARRIAYVAQRQQPCELTVADYILLGRQPHFSWNPGREDEEVAFAIMARLHLGPLARRPLARLSGGELQKTVIARALVQKPAVLLLDEPTSNLDLKNQLEVMDIVRRETGERHLTTVVTMHDINLALRYGTTFTLLKDGRVMVSGGPEVITAASLSALFGLPVRLHRLDGGLAAMPA